MGLEIFLYLFENRYLTTLEERETPIAYCSVSIDSLRFDQCFMPFFRHSAICEIFIKLNLPILLVLVGQRKKLPKCFDLSVFKLEFE